MTTAPDKSVPGRFSVSSSGGAELEPPARRNGQGIPGLHRHSGNVGRGCFRRAAPHLPHAGQNVPNLLNGAVINGPGDLAGWQGNFHHAGAPDAVAVVNQQPDLGAVGGDNVRPRRGPGGGRGVII